MSNDSRSSGSSRIRTASEQIVANLRDCNKRCPIVRDAVSGLPGVESVSLARELLGGNEVQAQVPDSDRKISVGQAIVDGNYFSTLGIRILAGRVFNSADRENSQEVVARSPLARS